ncbi:hypothetical protein P280DRAFT_518868 [Massarina eburnea CBS 473.64]|uniref:Uncharacterized protein n=1 Tax=Massarina eburnea CBS 473.64 TaxID=1395130 RepID=A0A6A6RV82_9PLEO|nr:hypothetical protein P280DRAFT_518868 [Massarina eburnea CBS 473.64]
MPTTLQTVILPRADATPSPSSGAIQISPRMSKPAIEKISPKVIVTIISTCGGVVLFVVLMGLAHCLRKRRNKKRAKKQQRQHDFETWIRPNQGISPYAGMNNDSSADIDMDRVSTHVHTGATPRLDHVQLASLEPVAEYRQGRKQSPCPLREMSRPHAVPDRSSNSMMDTVHSSGTMGGPVDIMGVQNPKQVYDPVSRTTYYYG